MNDLSLTLSTFRFVFGALVAGVVFFAIVVVILTDSPEMIWPPSTLSLVLMCVGGVVALQGVVLPGLIRHRIPGDADTESDADEIQPRLPKQWVTAALVGIALLESAAFMNLVGLLIEKNLIHLVVAGVCVILMFVHYPGSNRILDWIEQR